VYAFLRMFVKTLRMFAFGNPKSEVGLFRVSDARRTPLHAARTPAASRRALRLARSYEREHLATSRCMPKQKHCSTKKAQPAEPKALAYSTETKVDTASMVDARAPQVARLLDSALDAIAASFQATRTVVVDKEVVDGGPDHYARLTGAKRLLELTLAGRPRPQKRRQRV
jgi:hypothetical protein